jgi:hypothetical protein
VEILLLTLHQTSLSVMTIVTIISSSGNVLSLQHAGLHGVLSANHITAGNQKIAFQLLDNSRHGYLIFPVDVVHSESPDKEQQERAVNQA